MSTDAPEGSFKLTEAEKATVFATVREVYEVTAWAQWTQFIQGSVGT